MELLIKRPWFTSAHLEISGGASVALLNKEIRIWCAYTSSTGTRFFERCFHSPEGFRELMQRGAIEHETRYLQFTLQRPADLIYIPHLVAHVVFTLDTGSSTILSRWDAATTTNQQIINQTLHEYTFGVRRGKWPEIFRKKVCQHYEKVCFLKKGWKNIGNTGKNIVRTYLTRYLSRSLSLTKK